MFDFTVFSSYLVFWARCVGICLGCCEDAVEVESRLGLIRVIGVVSR